MNYVGEIQADVELLQGDKNILIYGAEEHGKKYIGI